MILKGVLSILHIKMASSMLRMRNFFLTDLTEFWLVIILFTYYRPSFRNVIYEFTGLCTGSIILNSNILCECIALKPVVILVMCGRKKYDVLMQNTHII